MSILYTFKEQLLPHCIDLVRPIEDLDSIRILRIVTKRSRHATLLSTAIPTPVRLHAFFWTGTPPTVWVSESGKYKAAA